MAHCFLKKVGGGSSKLKSASGTYQLSNSANVSVDLGFKPKFLAIRGTATTITMIYNKNYSSSTFKYATSGNYSSNQNLNTSTAYRLKSIDNNGFTVNKGSSSTNYTFYYFAIGE